MMPNDYYNTIVNALQGKTPELERIPAERLDWSGSGAVLELYEGSSGEDRNSIIQAMGRIIGEGDQPVPVVAQVLHIVASLDIAQVEPNVMELERKPIASEEPIRRAIANYQTFRHFHRSRLS